MYATDIDPALRPVFEKPRARRHALRRKARERMKARARRLYPDDPNACLADHLAACSCAACGNARRHFGTLTIQERRSIDAAAFAVFVQRIAAQVPGDIANRVAHA